MRSLNSRSQSGVLRVLIELSRAYKKRFLLIAILALLATSADLMQPLIYRVAINDVAGLFVERHSVTVTVDPVTGEPVLVPGERAESNQERLGHTHLPHGQDYLAPRTRQQALRTLLWAVALLFAIGVSGYGLSLAADYQSTVVASRIEARLIESTFGHVLGLPVSFFSRHPSGGLAKRIDQSDQVAPIVTAFSREIAPEALRLVGICAIMLTQNWKLSLTSLVVLPFYLVITRRAALRLESGMSGYYAMWENVSVRIQDALAAIKTR